MTLIGSSLTTKSGSIESKADFQQFEKEIETISHLGVNDRLVVLARDHSFEVLSEGSASSSIILSDGRKERLQEIGEIFSKLLEKEPSSFSLSIILEKLDLIILKAHEALRLNDQKSSLNEEMWKIHTIAQTCLRELKNFTPETPGSPSSPLEGSSSSTEGLLSRSTLFLTDCVWEYNHSHKQGKYEMILGQIIKNFEKEAAFLFQTKLSMEQLCLDLRKKIDDNKSNKENLELQEMTCKLIEILRSVESYQNKIDFRQKYAEFNLKLREVLNLIENQEYLVVGDDLEENPNYRGVCEEATKNDVLCENIVYLLAYIKFAQVTISSYLEDTVKVFVDGQDSKDSFYPVSLDSEICSESLPTILYSDNAQIAGAPTELKKSYAALALQKLKGHFNFNFDPSLNVNVPYLRSIALYLAKPNNLKKVYCLRHGTPTIEDLGILESGKRTVGKALAWVGFGSSDSNQKQAEVTPEYKAFLKEAYRRGDIVLYCNHQKLEEKVLGDESDRCAAILSLEKSNPNFHFLSLPMGDGPFFSKDKIEDIAEFRETFLNIFNNNDDNYGVKIPEIIKDENFWQILNQIFDAVWGAYFLKKEKLSYQEKWVFILAFNAYLKDYVKFGLYEKALSSATSEEERRKLVDGKIFIVSSCKDNIDRGGTSTTLDEYLNLFRNGQENDPQMLRELRINHAAPAILVKQQNVIPGRQLLVELFVDHLNKLPKDQKKTIRQLSFTNWQLKQQNWSSKS